MHSGGFAPAFTLSMGDSERSRKPPNAANFGHLEQQQNKEDKENKENNMDYTLGIEISLILSILIGIFFIYIYLTFRPWSKNSHRLPINDSGYYILISLFFFFIASTCFCFFYSIFNIILNYETCKNYIGTIAIQELKNGVLAMRFSSISLWVTFLFTLIKIVQMTPFPNVKSEQEYNNYKEAKSIGLSNYQPIRNRFEHYFLNLTQSSFYSLTLTVLWSLYFLKIDSLYSVLLSYFLFLIIDDWTLVYDYSLRLKGYIIKKHFIKVLILNIILLFVGLLATFNNLFLLLSFGILGIYILIINYLNYQKRLFVKVQYEYEKT